MNKNEMEFIHSRFGAFCLALFPLSHDFRAKHTQRMP